MVVDSPEQVAKIGNETPTIEADIASLPIRCKRLGVDELNNAAAVKAIITDFYSMGAQDRGKPS